MPKRTRDHQSWLLEKLTDPERAAVYLNTALEDSKEMFLEALRDVAQAEGMSQVARGAGVTRKSLYDATSITGNPTLETLAAIFKVLDLRLSVQPKGARTAPVAPPSVNPRRVLRYPKSPRAARTILKEQSISVGVQMAFNFESPAPAPQIKEIALLPRPILIVTSTPAATENLLPAHLCNILSKGNYGYQGNQVYNPRVSAE